LAHEETTSLARGYLNKFRNSTWKPFQRT